MSNRLNAKSMRGCPDLGGLAVAATGLVILVTMLLQAPEAGITADPGFRSDSGGIVEK